MPSSASVRRTTAQKWRDSEYTAARRGNERERLIQIRRSIFLAVSIFAVGVWWMMIPSSSGRNDKWSPRVRHRVCRLSHVGGGGGGARLRNKNRYRRLTPFVSTSAGMIRIFCLAPSLARSLARSTAATRKAPRHPSPIESQWRWDHVALLLLPFT